MPAPPRALSFDCFGTLIDWRAGQLRVLAQLPSLRGQEPHFAALLARRELREQELQAGPFRRYEEILAESLRWAVREHFGQELPEGEARAFAASQLGWPSFPDTAPALRGLATRFPLALLSNCDQETLDWTARKHFGVPVLALSSESVARYKPDPKLWEELLSRTGLAPAEVLHVSFTREYDLDTAHRLGFRLGFVARHQAPCPEDLPLAEVHPDLSSLADALLA